MKKHFVFLFALLAVMNVFAGKNNIDLLQQATTGSRLKIPGIYSLGEMLKPFREGFLWYFPEGPQVPNKISLGETPVKPMTHYRLEWAVNPAQRMQMGINLFYPDENGEAMPLHLMTFSNSSAYTLLSKDIFTPPGVDTLELECFLYDHKFNPGAHIGYMDRFRLVEVAPIAWRQELADFYGKNLLPISDFSQFELGESDQKKLGLMSHGMKPFAAEVVSVDDKKVLRLQYTPGDYQYITWFSSELPLHGSAGTIRFQIRGKGRAQFMLWFNRPGFHTIFKHFGYFDLPEEWTEYQLPFGCDDPLTMKIGAAIACRDAAAQIEILNLSLIIANPQENTP
ncbi:MAG: hypothetical protein GX946_06440 [Oligosphaeraceae bacterium]|nr:hypothetical protein [Oligosphaeraceae bacterium]